MTKTTNSSFRHGWSNAHTAMLCRIVLVGRIVEGRHVRDLLFFVMADIYI